MDTMLGDELETAIDAMVREGAYSSREDVLRDGVRLVRQREEARRELRASLEEGLADVEAGRTKPADEVFDRLRKKYDTMVQDRQCG